MQGFFLPTHTKTKLGKHAYVAEGEEGIAILTNLKNTGFKHYFYKGKGKVLEFTSPETHDRALLYTTIEYEGKQYTIGVTHFTWSENGKATDIQRKDFESLMKFLKRFDSLILCGDFNAPRGQEIYTKFTEHYNDNLPPEVKTTIDQNLHRKKGIMLAVDTIFTTPDIKVSNVRVVDGVSDHKAIIGVIE